MESASDAFTIAKKPKVFRNGYRPQMALNDNGTVSSTQSADETSKVKGTGCPTEPAKMTITSGRTVSQSQMEEKDAIAEGPVDNHDGLTGWQLLRQVSSE